MKPDDPAIREAHRAGWEAAMNTLNPSQRSPYPGMPPMRDGMRAPLPTAVRTPDNLNVAMWELSDWAGEPPPQQRGLPKADMLRDFVKACGAQDDWPAWFEAWRKASDDNRRTQTA